MIQVMLQAEDLFASLIQLGIVIGDCIHALSFGIIHSDICISDYFVNILHSGFYDNYAYAAFYIEMQLPNKKSSLESLMYISAAQICPVFCLSFICGDKRKHHNKFIPTQST